MIVARTLASAARSCIQRCRQSRGRDLLCSSDRRPRQSSVTCAVPAVDVRVQVR
jgi:hypothetical protein